MLQYRQVLVRLRAGDSVRELARSGLMGRDKLGELCAVALEHGWLDTASAVPDDAMIVAARLDFGAGPTLRHPDGRMRRRRLEEPNPGADLRRKDGDDSPFKVCALFDLPMSALPFGGPHAGVRPARV